jgi:hypothetical protein
MEAGNHQSFPISGRLVRKAMEAGNHQSFPISGRPVRTQET